MPEAIRSNVTTPPACKDSNQHNNPPCNFEQFHALAHRESSYYPPFQANTRLNPLQAQQHAEARKMRVKFFIWLSQCLKLKPEVAAMASSIYDRYMNTPRGNSNSPGNLVAACAFYIAVKTHELLSVKPSDLVYLYRNQFNEADLFAQEREMLKTLGWHVNPPTMIRFTDELIAALNLSAPCQKFMEKCIQQQADVLLMSENISDIPKYKMACVLLINAINMTKHQPQVLPSDINQMNAFIPKFEAFLSQKLGVFLRSPEMRILWGIVNGEVLINHEMRVRLPASIRGLDQTQAAG